MIRSSTGANPLLRNVCKVITQQYYMWKVVINLPVSFLNLTYLRIWSGWRWLDHSEEYIGIPQTVLFLADSAMPWAKACQTVRLPRQVTWAQRSQWGAQWFRVQPAAALACGKATCCFLWSLSPGLRHVSYVMTYVSRTVWNLAHELNRCVRNFPCSMMCRPMHEDR